MRILNVEINTPVREIDHKFAFLMRQIDEAPKTSEEEHDLAAIIKSELESSYRMIQTVRA